MRFKVLLFLDFLFSNLYIYIYIYIYIIKYINKLCVDPAEAGPISVGSCWGQDPK
jgi:hypothetical protein